MELRENKFEASKGRFKVLLTFTVALAGLLVLIQTLAFSMVPGTSPAFAQGPVITPTITTDPEIQAYIDAHIIYGDVAPPDTGEGVVGPGTQGSVATGVAWDGNGSLVRKPGEVAMYSLTLSNTGMANDTFTVTADSNWAFSLSDTSFTVDSGSVTSVGLEITVPGGAASGDFDTAVITATSQTDPMVTASMLVTTTAGSEVLYFPVLFNPLLPPTLSATRPNSANDWEMNWTGNNDVPFSGFELQQSQVATFASGVTTYNLAGTATNQLINTIQPSANNVYYYRVRGVSGNQMSPWSNVVTVVGAYYDEFKSNQTGWSGNTLKEGLRRLTYIERTDAWYENNDWLIIRVEDSWDWAIASPLKPAPTPPYAIEFRSMPANLGNLVSHGVVFGGDWGGAPCPNWSTLQGVYAHNNCFNHFYNTNLIWSSDTDLTLLWERVDTLVYCPTCGGSPLKRLGDVPAALPFNPNASGWNDYRIEVRSSGIKFFMNGALRYTYNDTRWINDPYFGVFASTDEYSNSTWRYEYLKVTPLDN